MRALLVGTALATVALAVLASTASATAPQATTIAGTVTQFGAPPDFQGTWQASGGISDAGSFVETELHPTGALANSPTVGVFQAIIVFSGSKGTFIVAQQSQFTSFPEGTWQIQSGTGVYERLSGHGTFAFTPPNSLTFRGLTSKAG
jgi:hypothetical protein